jgi:hypothetical protein
MVLPQEKRSFAASILSHGPSRALSKGGSITNHAQQRTSSNNGTSAVSCAVTFRFLKQKSR